MCANGSINHHYSTEPPHWFLWQWCPQENQGFLTHSMMLMISLPLTSLQMISLPITSLPIISLSMTSLPMISLPMMPLPIISLLIISLQSLATILLGNWHDWFVLWMILSCSLDFLLFFFYWMENDLIFVFSSNNISVRTFKLRSVIHILSSYIAAHSDA